MFVNHLSLADEKILAGELVCTVWGQLCPLQPESNSDLQGDFLVNDRILFHKSLSDQLSTPQQLSGQG